MHKYSKRGRVLTLSTLPSALFLSVPLVLACADDGAEAAGRAYNTVDN